MAPQEHDASMEPPSHKRASMMASQTSTRHRSASVDMKLMRSASIVDDATKDAAKSKRQAKLMGYFAMVMVCFLGISAIANFAIIFHVVDKQVQTQTVADTLVSKNDPEAIVATREAEQNIALALAPALDTATLSHVKKLSTTLYGDYNDYLNGFFNMTSFMIDHTFEREYLITGFARQSETAMTFFTSSGDKVKIENGQAWVEATFGHHYPVCYSEATCSSLRAHGVNVTEVEERAFAALARRHANATIDLPRMAVDEPGAAGRRLMTSPRFNKAYLHGREMLWDFGCCSGGLATGGADHANCNEVNVHETGAGYELSEACRTHDSCLLGCNGNCGCRGNCDSSLASNGDRASCSNGQSWWRYRYSCSCAALKPLLVTAMRLRPNQWLLGGCGR